jgi:hypothetical protein
MANYCKVTPTARNRLLAAWSTSERSIGPLDARLALQFWVNGAAPYFLDYDQQRGES